MARTSSALILCGIAIFAHMGENGYAQTVTSGISRSGDNVLVTVPADGNLMVATGSELPVTIATSDDVRNSSSLLMDEIQGVIDNVTVIQDLVAQLVEFKSNTLTCAAVGKLYDETADDCVYPVPSMSSFATAQRMDSAEYSIEQIETALNGTNGTHTFCNICPRNHYVSTRCNDHTNTVCTPCAAGYYSLGGFAETCTSCASQVPNCGFATCTSPEDVSCQYCDMSVTLGNAYVLSAPNTCTKCSPYHYRSSNSTCSACPKDGTCSQARCQANSGSVIVSGTPSMSSIYNLGVLRPAAPILAAYNDGVTTGSALHSNVRTTAQKRNPWFQLDIGQGVMAGIDRLVYWNRNGAAGCRAFQQDNGSPCFTTVLQATGRVWNGTNQGTVFGVSDVPVSGIVTRVRTIPRCTTPGQRNCTCAYLSVYDPSNRYEISCNGATGRYVYMVTPGTNRIMNFAELKVYGTYSTRSPQMSTCVTPCAVGGCQSGQQTCPSTPGGNGTCASGGCVRDVVSGSGGYGYVSSTRQCTACTSRQYLSTAGACVACPSRCGTRSCQVNSVITGGSASQSSTYNGYYGAFVARIAGNINRFTHTHTQTNAWWQLRLGASETVTSVTVAFRRGRCGSRSLHGTTTGCVFDPANVPAGVGNAYDRDFNGTNEGTIIRVATSACRSGQTCPGTVCGRIFRPQTGGRSVASYTVTCATPITGNYVSVQLPGSRRIQQLSRVVVTRDVRRKGPVC